MIALRSFVIALCALFLVACSEKEPAPAPVTPAERTLLMYLPWSGDSQALTAFFERNIEDMESVVATGVQEGDRVLVFFMPTSQRAELFELVRKGNGCVRREHIVYDPLPAFTTAEGIARILADVRRIAPAARYAMTIGCHGMAWLPVSAESPRPLDSNAPREREHWEYGDGVPVTRWFGGASSNYRTDIATLAAGIRQAGMHMEYMLFDDCYMSSVEVAYTLRDVADHLIGSTSEIMAYGFPYAEMGQYLVGRVDYEAIAESFYRFYLNYTDPYGTIAVIDCRELEALAAVMRRINERFPAELSAGVLDNLQALDGYRPVRFFDMGDYVRALCTDAELLAEFEAQLARTVPPAWHRHTPSYFSAPYNVHSIRTYSGITTSDPSVSPSTGSKTQTQWWLATH